MFDWRQLTGPRTCPVDSATRSIGRRRRWRSWCVFVGMIRLALLKIWGRLGPRQRIGSINCSWSWSFPFPGGVTKLGRFVWGKLIFIRLCNVCVKRRLSHGSVRILYPCISSISATWIEFCSNKWPVMPWSALISSSTWVSIRVGLLISRSNWWQTPVVLSAKLEIV